MKTNPFYKYNKNRNMDPKEKENINEEELMSEAVSYTHLRAHET